MGTRIRCFVGKKAPLRARRVDPLVAHNPRHMLDQGPAAVKHDLPPHFESIQQAFRHEIAEILPVQAS